MLPLILCQISRTSLFSFYQGTSFLFFPANSPKSHLTFPYSCLPNTQSVTHPFISLLCVCKCVCETERENTWVGRCLGTNFSTLTRGALNCPHQVLILVTISTSPGGREFPAHLRPTAQCPLLVSHLSSVSCNVNLTGVAGLSQVKIKFLNNFLTHILREAMFKENL